MEGPPAGGHIIPLGNGIGPAVETQFIIIGWRGGITGRCDIVEVAAVVTATADSVEGWIEETHGSLTLMSRRLISQGNHGCPHRSCCRGTANGQPATRATT